MKQTTGYVAVVCLVLTALPCRADPYFSASTIPSSIIGPPLKPTDPEWQNEIDKLLNIQANAGSEVIQQAEADRAATVDMVTEARDPDLTRTNYPKLYHLFDRSFETADAVMDGAKAYWHAKKRPFQLKVGIKPLVRPHYSYSYPSGHAIKWFVWAYVLSILLPKEREELLADAKGICDRRVMAGMHLQHDIRAGHELALVIVGALLQNAEFNRDLQSAAKRTRIA